LIPIIGLMLRAILFLKRALELGLSTRASLKDGLAFLARGVGEN
jgi:hypothetical protein